ncbi:MAG: RagB/SusD family nutrient uptake outer membrane protein [Sphingobacteriales bacterium]|nr:RagB/SusD family nutrient uptake outer membrane protein [Sphingobacteriales bacterium]
MKLIKSFFTILIAGSVLVACKKDSLKQINPNAPTPDLSLATEQGLKNFALGIMQKTLANVPDEGITNIMHISFSIHSALGDEVFQPYGNFSIRWVNQVYQITLPNGTVVTNPNGLTQKAQLQGFNSRDAGERNAFVYEWSLCYYFIGQSNQLLKSLDNNDISFSGDAATKKAALKAWAHWWKGWSYARIGSMYLAGLVVDEAGEQNPNYVTRDKVIEEAFKNLDACSADIDGVTSISDYNSLMQAIIPTFNNNTVVVAPDMWKRQINSFKARTLLANKKVAQMTDADWNAVKALTDAGLKAGDNVFVFGMDPNALNDISAGWQHPYAYIGDFVQYTFVSERLIQEYKTGDNRLTKNFIKYTDMIPPQSPFVNIRGRGLQLGTRWNPIPIEGGDAYGGRSGSFATNNNKGTVPIGSSVTENDLMKAECLINLGQTDAGLAIVDAIRNAQGAAIAAVSGTGLSKAQALTELRRERRVALFLQGTAFYDARRWGVTAPKANGGGRDGGIVLVPGALLGSANAFEAVPCFLDYNYLDYWDVPQNELDFNAPAPGSAPVKN